MSDEVEHYLAVYNQDDSMTTGIKTGGKSVEGVSHVRWTVQDDPCPGPSELSDRW